MKNTITKTLLENYIRETLMGQGIINSLDVAVTKPKQELIILRGIPGSGKSTKAKSLAGSGKIHSTDDVIDSSGDYREFFAKMIANKDFTPLSNAHETNLKNAIKSMEDGVSPIIIDNTNIKQNESKAYIVAALKLGYADNNIKFIDIGTAGLEAAELAKRNTHGVPLEKIEAMIASHTAQGPLTLKSVLNSSDMYKPTSVSYSAVVLDDKSRTALLEKVGKLIPSDFKVIAHHMTINMGPLKDKSGLDKDVTLTVTEIGLSDMAMAVKVEGYKSENTTPHITIAVNQKGGKPKDSNNIKEWYPIENFKLNGKVTEVKN